jgi:hypothetical protein
LGSEENKKKAERCVICGGFAAARRYWRTSGMLPTSPQSDKLCLRCKAELFIGELPNRFETEHEAELNAIHRLFGEEF